MRAGGCEYDGGNGACEFDSDPFRQYPPHEKGETALISTMSLCGSSLGRKWGYNLCRKPDDGDYR